MSNTSSTDESSPRVPRHVAIIMDGNGRWAKRRHLPRTAGHQAGVSAVRKTVEHCAKRGVEVLTLFAFSSENWRRPEEEVNVLMRLFMLTLDRETKKLNNNNIRLRVIGDRSAFPDLLQRKIEESEKMTQSNQRMTLVIAANYGGRWDIAQAARKLAQEVKNGALSPDQIDEPLLAARLSNADLPEPDLFIRTGGEKRISNFLLWHLAYTELYFTETLWPDFDEKSLDEAITEYGRRERRFGYTSEQLTQVSLSDASSTSA